MINRPLILASTSRWRLELLGAAGLRCEAVAPEVDEASIHGSDPATLAQARALAKARAVAARRPDALVIGADQVAHGFGEVFGKPTDPADHLARLRSLRARTHHLTTGVALVGGGEEIFAVTSAVRFREDSEDHELTAYVALGEGAGCAGGYMLEARGAWLIEAVDGDWLNGVGLPVMALVGRLRARGWRLTEQGPRGPGLS